MTEFAIAVDDAGRFVAAMERARDAPAAAERRAPLAWFVPADLAEALA